MANELGIPSCCVLFIISIALFASSFCVCGPNQYAFDHWDTYKKVDAKTVYSQGRHFLGVGHKFIFFPSQIRIAVDEMNLRTSDGLSVKADIEFWYLINPEHAMELYYEFGQDYNGVFRLMVRSELRDVAARYKATEIVAKREELAQDMEDGLKSMFDELESGGAIEVTRVFLRRLDLPGSFNEAIQRTVVAEQDVKTAEFEVQIADIAAVTKKEEAAIVAKKFILSANATAEATEASAAADADIAIRKAETRATAYKDLQTQVEMGGTRLTSESLLTYIFVDGVRSNGASDIKLSLDEPESLA